MLARNHPVQDSVTKWFYDAGWRGVNVEPVPSLFQRFKKDRPRDVNIASAVGGSAQGVVTFHTFGETG